MGLDMYAFASERKPATATDFEIDDATTLHYWRKHPNLHGWMRDLHRSKGGANPAFNTSSVALTAEDLTALEAAVRDGALPETSGFFFGHSDGTEAEDDLDFIAKAREAIRAGLTVFYTSWW